MGSEEGDSDEKPVVERTIQYFAIPEAFISLPVSGLAAGLFGASFLDFGCLGMRDERLPANPAPLFFVFHGTPPQIV